MSFSKPQVNFSSNSASHSSAMKYNFSVLFLAQTCTLAKSCPLKCKFLRLLSSCVKICQILYVNFETASQLLFRFFIILQCHAHITSVYFQPIHFQLWTKGSHESTNFDIFKCSDENLPNLSCHFPITSQFFFKFFRVFSTWIKIHQIFVIFETKIGFSFKFCTTLWYHET